MALTVQTTIRRPGSNVFFDPLFRVTLEQHLPLLRQSPDTQVTAVSADDLYRFEGDLYGLLHKLGHPVSQHWLIMRLNHYDSPSHFGKELHDEYSGIHQVSLMIPPELLVEQIKKQYLTKRS